MEKLENSDQLNRRLAEWAFGTEVPTFRDEVVVLPESGAENDLYTGPSQLGSFRAAVSDIRNGVSSWRIWTMLAWNDIRTRYRRSTLGQLWLTLSMGIMIGGLGLVYSTLFNTDPSKYVPFLVARFVSWSFISTIVLESCNAFIENQRIILHADCAKSIFIFRVLYRNLLVLGHNLLIVPVVFLIFPAPHSWHTLLLIPGLAIVALNAFWMSFFLAIICARYRDVPQIINTAMQLVFFVTPVMYMPEQLSQRMALIKWNPFANLLELLADPLLGQLPSLWAYGFSLGLLAVGLTYTVWFVGRYSKRIVYWL